MKQELIEKIKQNQIKDRIESEYTGGINEGLRIAISCVEKAFEQSKEIVPQFVADWFGEGLFEELDWDLSGALTEAFKVGREERDDFQDWLVDTTNYPIETLVRMKLFGYEIEKDTVYYVASQTENTFLEDISISGAAKRNNWLASFTENRIEATTFNDIEIAEAFAKIVNGTVMKSTNNCDRGVDN